MRMHVAMKTNTIKGTDTRKIQSHPKNSVMTPERMKPSTSPQLATAAHTLSARDRTRPSGNKRTITAIAAGKASASPAPRSEEHTSELQSRFDLVCRLLLEKKKDTD